VNPCQQCFTKRLGFSSSRPKNWMLCRIVHKLFYRELYSILHPVALLNSSVIVRLEKFGAKIVIILVLTYQIDGTDCSTVSHSYLRDSKAHTGGHCCKLHSCLQTCSMERDLLSRRYVAYIVVFQYLCNIFY
jgi:hypothetical protein